LIVSILYLYFSFAIFLNLLFPYSCPIISLLLTYYLFFTYDFPMFSPIVSLFTHSSFVISLWCIWLWLKIMYP
jgi:hypothetical protein